VSTWLFAITADCTTHVAFRLSGTHIPTAARDIPLVKVKLRWGVVAYENRVRVETPRFSEFGESPSKNKEITILGVLVSLPHYLARKAGLETRVFYELPKEHHGIMNLKSRFPCPKKCIRLIKLWTPYLVNRYPCFFSAHMGGNRRKENSSWLLRHRLGTYLLD
jgi:hypothetical protein